MKSPRKSIGPKASSLAAIGVLLATHAISAAEGVTEPAGALVSSADNRAAKVHWIVDPGYPGEDLPPRGRSLFDYLVTQEKAGRVVQTVPYPFATLLGQLDAQMRQDTHATGIKGVLIPLGRSLQRHSAAPAFFAYPRAVVAADGEPASTGSIYVKDRLYLGYQEKANVLEVISYNEDAGRFEFQVVTDYRAGGTPRIAYANRVLCVACHQNAAPIFSRPVWDETNANPRVAARLAAHGKDFYGIVIDRGVDVPNAIDDAALRATRFAALQLLWSEGCGGNDESAVQCRAGLFTALLQYRLSGQQGFDWRDASYRTEVAARLIDVAQRRWPGGLALGNPDIPNRNPLPSDAPAPASIADRDFLALADVSEPFDPLRPRAPIETWRIESVDDASRVVVGLAGFIAEADVRQLDRELSQRASTGSSARRSYHSQCRIDLRDPQGGDQRIEFRCASARDAAGPGVSADGRLIVSGNAVKSGTIDRLQIDDKPVLRDIDLGATRVASSGTLRTATAMPRRGALHARAADGNTLERFELRWSGSGGRATLTVHEDFATVRSIVATLTRDSAAGTFDGLRSAAFRRARLMPALLAGLGATPGTWCCLDDSRLPPAQAARLEAPSEAAATAGVAAAHAPFYRYCGECHLSAERAPPNFLLGDTRAVEAKLRHCAPRMFVRLSMWQRAAGARAKTPMPPESALHRYEFDASAWRDGDALAGLLRSVDVRLRDEGASPAAVDAQLAHGYETLRACLPGESAPQPATGLQPRGTS